MRKNWQNNILHLLRRKPAVAKQQLLNTYKKNPADTQAAKRAVKILEDKGLIETIASEHNASFIRLTEAGKKHNRLKELHSPLHPASTTWDGFWRIVLVDIPEARRQEREALRYLLKKAGFAKLKNSAWVSPLPYEHLLANVKKDLGLADEMVIMTTNQIDPDSAQTLASLFK